MLILTKKGQKMSCSCHVNPPCGYCEQMYECDECGEIRHPEQHGINLIRGLLICDNCVEKVDKL